MISSEKLEIQTDKLEESNEEEEYMKSFHSLSCSIHSVRSSNSLFSMCQIDENDDDNKQQFISLYNNENSEPDISNHTTESNISSISSININNINININNSGNSRSNSISCNRVRTISNISMGSINLNIYDNGDDTVNGIMNYISSNKKLNDKQLEYVKQNPEIQIDLIILYEKLKDKRENSI